MVMNRTLLRTLLSAGPSRRFIAVPPRAADARGAPALSTGAPLPPETGLFRSRLLAHAIIVKFRDERDTGLSLLGAMPSPTLLYLPYDPAVPEEGGESLYIGRPTFERFVRLKSEADGALRAELAQDYERLLVFAGLPSLAPYLIADAFERAGHGVDPALLNLAPAVRLRIRNRLRERLRPLVQAALRDMPRHVGHAVDILITRMIDAQDLDGLRPLTDALRLDPEEASRTFQAWIGLTYFEDEFVALQPDLRDLGNWLVHRARPTRALGPAERAVYQRWSDTLRRHLRADWARALGVLKGYHDSYQALLEGGRSDGFLTFLGEVTSHYWVMGEVLGRLEQLVLCWRQRARRFGYDRMTQSVLDEFREATNEMYAGVDPPPSAPPPQRVERVMLE